LALTAGLVAMVTLGAWIGLGIGLATLVVLAGIKIAEMQHSRA
jgi:hypothetical protein